MDLDLTADQETLRDAVARIVSDNSDLPRTGGVVEPSKWFPAQRMEAELSAGGYFGIALQEGCGALEAALMVYETSLSPLVMECAGSALIAPLLTGEELPRPVAIARPQDLTRGVRFLDVAQTLILLMDDDVVIVPAAQLQVETLTGPYAYPMGKLAAMPDLAGARRLGAAKVAECQRLWRLAIALEIGAAMQGAIDFTTDYVRQRHVFARPVGSFQAVQHRLSADMVRSRGVYWLAIKAAWSGSPADASLAAIHAQRSIAQVVYDAHQFNGALGMTLEHALHFWTFRLRWLAGEMGGPGRQAADGGALVWADAAG